MGHVDERDPDLLLDPLELDLHLLAQLEVERAERLVEEEDGGSVDERPGQRDPLRLAAGDLGRLALLEAGQLDQLEHVGDARLDLVALDLLAPQPEGDVVLDRQVREQRVVLEDRVDVPLVRRQPGHVLERALAGRWIGGPQLDQARGGLLEPADHPEGGRLAAAGRPEEGEELAVLDLEVDVVDGGGFAEALDDIDETHIDSGHGPSDSWSGEVRPRLAGGWSTSDAAIARTIAARGCVALAGRW